MKIHVGTASEREIARPITPKIERIEEHLAPDGLRWLTWTKFHGYVIVDFDGLVVGEPDEA